MLNSLGVGILLTARDEASAIFNRVSKSFLNLDNQSAAFVKRMEGNARQMKASLALMGAGLLGIHGAFVTADKAGKFEQAIVDLGQLSRASATDLARLKQAAIEAGIATQFPPMEAAKALQELATRGYDATESLDLLKPALNFAAASLGQLGIPEAVDLANQSMKAFGYTTKDASKMFDQLIVMAHSGGLQPKDLPNAVGIAARGANLMNQSLRETLISVGLAKNILGSTERAATSVAVAMQMMAAPGIRQAKWQKQLGVGMADTTGKFHDFLDVVLAIDQKTRNMKGPERAMLLARSFGADAAGSILAVIQQQRAGLHDEAGKMVYGADFNSFLRRRSGNSEGVAKQMADSRLDTFEGQKTLLHGSMETLAITVGEPFAKIFKPIVGAIIGFVNKLIAAFQSMPAGLKEGIAKIFLIGSAIATAVGAMLAGKAIMALFGVTLGVIGAAAASLAAPLAIAGAAIAAVMLLVKAFQENARQTGGGVLGTFAEMASKIKLVFQGLMQIFSPDGGFSGKVMEDMNRAENGGVKAFTIKVAVWIERIRNFFRGLSEGFSAGIKRAQPVFDNLVEALKTLASLFGVSVGGANDNIKAWQDASGAGANLGDTIATVAKVLVTAFTIGVRAATLIVFALKNAWDLLGPVVMAVGGIIAGVVKWIGGIFAGDWGQIWRGALKVVLGIVELILSAVGVLVKGIAGFVDMIGKVFGKNLGLKDSVSKGIAEATDELSRWTNKVTGPGVTLESQVYHNPFVAMPGEPAENSMSIDPRMSVPAANQSLMSAATARGASPAIASTERSDRGLDAQSIGLAVAAATRSQPLVVNSHTTVKLDNEVIGQGQSRKRLDQWMSVAE